MLSLGKDHVYIWENDETKLHEDEAAKILQRLCQNEGMEATEPKEGKIELKALHDGVFHVDEERFDAINELDDIAIATIPQDFPVKKGTKLAGMRVIPLVIDKTKMEEAERLSDRIAVMIAGRIAACGTLAEIKAMTGAEDLETAFVAIAEKEGAA